MQNTDQHDNIEAIDEKASQKREATKAAVLRYIEEQENISEPKAKIITSKTGTIREIVTGVFGILMFFIGSFIFDRRVRKQFVFSVIIKILIPVLLFYWLAGNLFAGIETDSAIR